MSFRGGAQYVPPDLPLKECKLTHIKSTDTYVIDLMDGGTRLSVTWEQLLRLRLEINKYELGYGK